MSGPDETRSDPEREAIWDDVHAELSLALGVDDSDDGWVDAKNAATEAIMRLFDREVADRSRLERERDELLAAMTELKRAPDRIATMTDVELEQYARRLERENTELRKQIESHDEMRLAAYAAAERDAARAEADRLREAMEKGVHRLRLTAGRTADYTPEGVSIRINADADFLAAALAAGGSR